MIHARFHLVGQTPDDNREISRYTMTQIPERGELLTLLGEPFMIVDRRWAIEANGEVYVTIRIMALVEQRLQ